MKICPMALMAVAVLAAAGCATKSQGVRVYPGAARSAGEVAQLVAASEFDVKSVDGAKAGTGMFATAGETVFEMLPGQHEVVARFYSPFEGGISSGGNFSDKPDRSGLQTLRFDAAAGRKYSITRKTENRDVTLFIEEAGATVALGSSAVALRTVHVAPTVEKIPEENAPPATASAAPVKSERVETPKITPLDNLKQWWFYASPKERAAFRMWMDAAK